MKKIIYLFTGVLLLTTVFSCASTRKEIPDDATPAQIIQLGQAAYTQDNYKDAEYYYSLALARFGTDTESYIEIKYELSHLYIVTEEYRKAYNGFKEILSIYEAAPYGALPPSYKKLCDIGLTQIPQNLLEEFDKATAE